LSTLKRFVLNRLTHFCIHADATQRGYFAKSRRQNLKWVKLETLNVKLPEYIMIVPEGKTTTTTIIEAKRKNASILSSTTEAAGMV